MSPAMVAPLVALAALLVLPGSAPGGRSGRTSTTIAAERVADNVTPVAAVSGVMRAPLHAARPGLLELLGLQRR